MRPRAAPDRDVALGGEIRHADTTAKAPSRSWAGAAPKGRGEAAAAEAPAPQSEVPSEARRAREFTPARRYTAARVGSAPPAPSAARASTSRSDAWERPSRRASPPAWHPVRARRGAGCLGRPVPGPADRPFFAFQIPPGVRGRAPDPAASAVRPDQPQATQVDADPGLQQLLRREGALAPGRPARTARPRHPTAPRHGPRTSRAAGVSRVGYVPTAPRRRVQERPATGRRRRPVPASRSLPFRFRTSPCNGPETGARRPDRPAPSPRRPPAPRLALGEGMLHQVGEDLVALPRAFAINSSRPSKWR